MGYVTIITQVITSLSSPPHSLPTTHKWIKKFTSALEQKHDRISQKDLKED